MISNDDWLDSQLDSEKITFGKYKGFSARTMLKDRSYALWLAASNSVLDNQVKNWWLRYAILSAAEQEIKARQAKCVER